MARHRPDRGPEPVSVLLAEHEPAVAEMSARYLRRDGLRVRLVASPESTLAELTGGPDAAAVIDLSRRQLLVAAGRQGASDRTADVYIAQIRAKLSPAVRIRTVRGAGYALDPLHHPRWSQDRGGSGLGG